MHFGIVQLTGSATTHASRTRTLLKPIVIGKDLAIEESQIVWTSPIEALVRVGVRRELVYDALSVLGTATCQELICALTTRVRLRTGEVIDQLAATARALVPLLKFLLHQILRLWTSTAHLLLGKLGLLGAADLSTDPIVISAARHREVVSLLSVLRSRIANLRELFLIGE